LINPSNSEVQHYPLPNEGFEAIILAGGLGTRLKSVVADLPKCMAPVNGKPFLFYVITYLQKQGVKRFIFSLGYMSESIELFLINHFPTLDYVLSVEASPLGTGGAIYLACKKGKNKNVLVLNGDTLFKVDVNAINSFHIQMSAACTLSLKPMQFFDRYGVVALNEIKCISAFEEKRFFEKGLINGGVYMINKELFLSKKFPEKFSFEKDYLEKYVAESTFFGIEQDVYFIDIGIPEDFEKAQSEFKNMDI
jgi:D-glycero-alpha-D-manno-heptose 1-phosphate guanylyltransferase